MRQVITAAFIFFATYSTGQDLGVRSILNPNSDCSLGSSEPVTIVIKNYNTALFFGNVNVSYKINAAAPVTESAALTILPGDSANYTFIATANLASTGTYTFKAYTGLVGDVNTANDTVQNHVVEHYPATAGGAVSANDTVCSGNNSGTLTLSGHTGNVIQWEFSTDGGNNWTSIANTNTSQSYLNLTTTTLYRALVQSGNCASVNSGSATITVIPSPNGGTLSGITTVCASSNSGTITLSGYTGTIINWEYSTDGGLNWNTLSNVTSTQNYNNLTQTTMYRVVVQSGACNSYSSVATITVSAATVGGSVTGSAAVCSGNNGGILQLSGETGSIVRWEYSTDMGSTWINISNTSNSQNYFNLAVTTLYRAVVQSGVCPQANSSPAFIVVDPVSAGGTVTGSASVCEGANNGVLTLSNFTGSIIRWESSINGGQNWTNISNSTSSQTYLNLSATTWYRAIVQSGVCSSDTSAPAIITVNSLPTANAGTDTSISLGYSIQLNGSGGAGYSWQPVTGLDNPAIQSPVASPTSTTTYTLTVTSADGCTATSSVEIKVIADHSFIIANLMTPNGDGLNDVWYIENIENYPLCEVAIFTIHDKEVFSAVPYKNDWDGTFQGKDLPDGTYYYVLKCPGAGKALKGYFTILRNK